MLQTGMPGRASPAPARDLHNGGRSSHQRHASRNSHRACDRCRRRKAKCNLTASESRCINCHAAGLACTFHLPLSKRGPKAPQHPGAFLGSPFRADLSSGLSPDLPARLPVGLPPDLPPELSPGLAQDLSQDPTAATSSPPHHAPRGVLAGRSPGSGLGSSTPFGDNSATEFIPGPGLGDLITSAIGWEPSAVQSRFASASTPSSSVSVPLVPPVPSIPAAATADTASYISMESSQLPPIASIVAGDPSAESMARAAQVRQRWQDLSQALLLRYPDPSASATDVVHCCISLFFDYLYPLTPLVHRRSLYAALWVVTGGRDGASGSDDGTSSSSFMSTQLEAYARPEPEPEPAFTLVTAVCAEAAFLLPREIFPEGGAIAETLLTASRSCLNAYLEADLENPNANSIIIRYFHSNCLHATGRPKYSWHIFGEATRLVQAMRLHDVRLLEGLPPLEAELRRRAFWIVYMGDKSAAILNSQPITIHRSSFDSTIAMPYPTGSGEGYGDEDFSDDFCDDFSDDYYNHHQHHGHHSHSHSHLMGMTLDMDMDLVDAATASPSSDHPATAAQQQRRQAPDSGDTPPKRSFIVGFNANLELWQVAANMLLEIRSQKEKEEKEQQQQQQQSQQPQTLSLDEASTQRSPPQPPSLPPLPLPATALPALSADVRRYFHSLYVDFITLLDRLPPYLQLHVPAPAAVSAWPPPQRQRNNPFVSQCVNLHVSFFCLRVVIMQNLQHLGLFETTPEQTDLRTTEIVREMLRVLHDAPFWALQVNGEPLVEKIRLMGASLLAILHRHADAPLALRARADFAVLLNILSRLDSKASDSLKIRSAIVM